MLNIYINTWGNYNTNGADLGKWITLPMDADELEETLERVADAMHDDDPEWFVNDYEWTTDFTPFEVHEMDNYFDLNEKCQKLDNLDILDQPTILAIIEATGYGFDEAFSIFENDSYVFYQDMDLEEVAEMFIEECYCTKGIPDIFTRYFDYAAFARDLSFDGYHETQWGVLYVE